MNGDSADPIIAAAYAFGVRNFDAKRPSPPWSRGPTQTETGHGLEIERQYLDQYLTQHYVAADSLDLTSIDYSIGGSVTLEYALDDFSIARLAARPGDRRPGGDDDAAGPQLGVPVQPGHRLSRGPRRTTGASRPDPPSRPSQLEPGGQLGFEEGNAIQYSWSVPQDLAALSTLMGGDAATVAKLDTFFTSLNATRNLPFDWAGNEPSLWTPWEYDYVGAPWRAQQTVRTIADTLYSDTPADEPGNDDLGALSSWYVWAALGMYPVTPGTADLALASPLFPEAVVTLPNGRRIVIHAPGASASTPYVHTLTVTGVAAPAPTSSCDPTTSAAADRAAPSTRAGRHPLEPAVAARLHHHHRRGADLRARRSTRCFVGSRTRGRSPVLWNGAARRRRLLLARWRHHGPGGCSHHHLRWGPRRPRPADVAVRWSRPGSGLAVFPQAGELTVGPSTRPAMAGMATCTPGPAASQPVTVIAPAAGSYVLDVHLQTSAGTALPPVVVDIQATG